MIMRGLFVTGTDTGVGKTAITRAVTRALIHRGYTVVALKPVESGVGDAPTDVEALFGAAGGRYPLDTLCRYRLRAPVSPHLAAQRECVRIEKEAILAMLTKMAPKADIVIAEGAGGLLVPLSDEQTYADVIQETGFRLLIVAPNALGAINSTLLTIEAARARDIEIAGVVLNRTPTSDLGNAEAIAHHGRVPILGEFPTTPSDDDDSLAALAEASLKLDLLLKFLSEP